jgi:hypothetical protein
MTKVKCSHTRKDTAWAIHGSDLPTCSSHSDRANKGGVPLGNTNAEKHSFYRTTLADQETADLVAYAVDDSIYDELSLCRVT